MFSGDGKRGNQRGRGGAVSEPEVINLAFNSSRGDAVLVQ